MAPPHRAAAAVDLQPCRRRSATPVPRAVQPSPSCYHPAAARFPHLRLQGVPCPARGGGFPTASRRQRRAGGRPHLQPEQGVPAAIYQRQRRPPPPSTVRGVPLFAAARGSPSAHARKQVSSGGRGRASLLYLEQGGPAAILLHQRLERGCSRVIRIRSSHCSRASMLSVN
ncbi:hypothetical protein C2845_PM02G07680 [Panicum miliaceum]|uniref:Uncharacterized protein n=1 Tax=Panicum miliaceum TaxID=4540 RepID=A0A3L6S756_PANMI|nr:hypothetical protein C2845_PM02G07680 [Panicum miliaceum]